MTTYEIKTDHDGQPMLCRKIQGRNADSMTGSEVIARGIEDIIGVKNALIDYEHARREQASGAAVNPLTPHWTDKTPTEAGHYWLRPLEDCEDYLIVSVEDVNGVLMMCTMQGFSSTLPTNGMWQGPIAPNQ